MVSVTFTSINDKVHHNGVVYTSCATLIGKTNNLDFFSPTKKLVYGYKYHCGDTRFSGYQPITEEEYTRRYALLLKSRSSQIRQFIDSINEDITIVCFCRKNVFCHRVLLSRWIKSYRPSLNILLF